MKESSSPIDVDDEPTDLYKTIRPKAVRSRELTRPAVVDTPAPIGPSLTYSSGKRAGTATNSSGSAGLQALDFLKMLADELSKGAVDLPCFPDIVLKIRDELNDPNTTVDKASRLIGAEPRLAARIVQTANSAALNASGKRITELKIAITRLGQQLVQSVAMAFAVQQIKEAPALQVIAEPLSELWRRSIAVASICQVVARRTTVTPDEAFLAGLLHGIGRLYIMVRATTKSGALDHSTALTDLIDGWHASIGKAVLENWEMGDELAQAVNDQLEVRRAVSKRGPDLTDILVVSLELSAKLADPTKMLALTDITPFQSIGLTAADCDAILTHASCQIGSLQDSLGC